MFWLAVILFFGANGEVVPVANAFTTEQACVASVDQAREVIAAKGPELGVVKYSVIECTALPNPITGKDA